MEPLASAVRSAEVVVPCCDLQATMDFFLERLGFRLEVIFPADAPSTAVISGHGVTLRLVLSGNVPAPRLRLLIDRSALPSGTTHELTAPNGMKIELAEANSAITVPEGKQEFVISRLGGADAWGTGRASMQYRDLIPSRLGMRSDRKSTRLNSSHMSISYAVFCLKKKKRYLPQEPVSLLHGQDERP